MKKEYLTEENYEKGKKVLKRISIGLYVLGALLIGLGIYFIIQSKNTVVPPMGDSNWFEQNTTKNSKQFSGIGLIMFGFFICGAATIVLMTAHRRSIGAFFVQQGMPIAQEGIEKISPSIGKAAKTIIKEVKEGFSETGNAYCSNCGKEINEDANFCKHCGHKLK